MMKCRNCGTEIPAASRFCPNCGLLTNIYIDFSEAYHPVDAVEYKLPERIAARIAARLENAGALAARPDVEAPEAEEREAETAADAELLATEIEETELLGAAAEEEEPEEDEAEAFASQPSAVEGEAETADEVGQIEESEAEAVPTSENTEQENMEEASAEAEESAPDSEKESKLPDEAGESTQVETAAPLSEAETLPERENAETERKEQEISLSAVRDETEASVEESAESSARVETLPEPERESEIPVEAGETEEDAEPTPEPEDEEVAAEAGETEEGEAEPSAVEGEAKTADEVGQIEESEAEAVPTSENTEQENIEEVPAEAEESAPDSEKESKPAAEAGESTPEEPAAGPTSEPEDETEETADEPAESAPENPELMQQLAEELERRRQAQEAEELSLLNERVLERIRQITGLDGTAQPKEDEAAAPVEPEAAEETEESAESAQIHDIADYREETPSEEDAEPAEILPMQELVAEEERYTGPDPAFEKLATMPPDPKQWRSAFRKNRRLLVPLGAAVIALGAVVFYMNTPEAKQSRLLRRGQKLVAEQNYDAAVPLLTQLLGGEADSQEVYLLLSEAYLNSGRHEDAVKLLSEAVEKLPEDSALAEKLRAIHPLVSISPSGETAQSVYTDPLELTLSNVDQREIHYTLRGGSEEITDALYQAPIELRYSGDYQLSAYAIASDGVHGPLAEAEYQISLDTEKYHLNDWVETENGRSFIDNRGETVKGWFYQDDKSYYFDENGYLLTGLQTIGQDSYYFAADGVMQTGWAELDGKRYFFDADGRMLHSAWIDETYYVGDDGVMLRDTTIDGVYVDANGARSFQAAAEYAAHPNMILLAKSGTRVDKGSYFEMDAELYYEKAEGRPSGEADRALKIKLQKDAWLHYLDGDLISIQAKDAVKFLPELYMQDIEQNEDGEITSFHMLLGKNR